MRFSRRIVHVYPMREPGHGGPPSTTRVGVILARTISTVPVEESLSPHGGVAAVGWALLFQRCVAFGGPAVVAGCAPEGQQGGTLDGHDGDGTAALWAHKPSPASRCLLIHQPTALGFSELAAAW